MSVKPAARRIGGFKERFLGKRSAQFPNPGTGKRLIL